MTDKKTFGSFVKAKRTEKGYSQKDLAEMLFVTEGAVSKWERGVSYPDITLLSDICRALEVSERELLTASADTETRTMKREARKFRVIRGVWVWVPTVLYAVALVTCFICNLAVKGTLSWFFIVLAALICAYTFVPTVTWLFGSKKLLVFAASTYLSVCLLLLTCAIYTDGLRWFLTACIGVLMGYELLFVPIVLSKGKYSRGRFVISISAAWILTMLLLLNVRLWHPFRLIPGLLIACYVFAPAILCACICTGRFDGFLKAGICTAIGAVLFYFANYVIALLLGPSGNHYQVDFQNWEQCISGNIHVISLISLLLTSGVFIAAGVVRIRGSRNG